MQHVSQLVTASPDVKTTVVAAPPRKNDVCPICNGAQYVDKDVPVSHPDFNKLYPCNCIRNALQAKRLARALENTGMPPAMQHMTFDNFDPTKAVRLEAPHRGDQSYKAGRIQSRIQEVRKGNIRPIAHMKAALATCGLFAKSPQGFLTLMGEPGSGKTHLAAAIAHYRLAQGEIVHFAVVPDLLDHLRATFSPGSKVSYNARIEAYKVVPLLVLDDLGTEKGTDWAHEKLYQIINYRYNWSLPLVITSNDLPTHLDPRLQSRLFDRQKNTVFEILAGDYRMRDR